MAVVDGATKEGVSIHPSVGEALSLRFPVFSNTLVYDPVLASQSPSSTIARRPQAHASLAC